MKTLKWLFLAWGIAVILPKAEMPYEGMIIRCVSDSFEIRISTDPNHPGLYGKNDPENPNRSRPLCHWECEFGIQTKNMIKDGVETIEQIGCAPKQEIKFHELNPIATICSSGEYPFEDSICVRPL